MALRTLDAWQAFTQEVRQNVIKYIRALGALGGFRQYDQRLGITMVND